MNPKKLRKLQITAFVIIASVVIYIPIMYFLKNYTNFTPFLALKFSKVEKISYYISAGLVLLVVILKRYLYFPSKIVNKTEKQASDKWFNLDIILMSIASTVGTIGLIGFLLGVPYFKALLLILISVLVIFVNFPFEMRYELRLKQLKEMKQKKKKPE